VVLRYGSIIVRGTVIHDNVFISPQFMTENVSHQGKQIGGAEIGMSKWHKKKTRYRVFIGTNVTLASGVKICSNVIIGSKTNVRKDILEPGVYVGNPARRKRQF
jgi:acetyltransferase-like isoleucine patch superfamily enzyme